MRPFSFALLAGFAAGVSAQTVRIMLLGDSITEWSCWRPMVWDQITAAGLAGNVDLVGSMNNLDSRCTRPAGFDPDHEGHSGWQAYDIAQNYITGWVQSTRPDVVQFMLGTNDVGNGRSVATIIDSFSMMLNAMRGANPNVKVVVDKLIPLVGADSTIDALNNAITTWVQQHTTPTSPIVIADCSRANGYNSAWNEDGVHPNLRGDEFIASQVGPLLVQFIRDVVGGGGGGVPSPPGTTTATPPSPTGSCAGLWGQCGGQGWTGPTCCTQGTCRVSNAWYSQCVG